MTRINDLSFFSQTNLPRRRGGQNDPYKTRKKAGSYVGSRGPNNSRWKCGDGATALGGVSCPWTATFLGASRPQEWCEPSSSSLYFSPHHLVGCYWLLRRSNEGHPKSIRITFPIVAERLLDLLFHLVTHRQATPWH